MKPSLKEQRDLDFLWENFDQIDVIESDHAPHTHEEKAAGAFGVPGLETTLPLLLQAEREGKLTRSDIVQKCADKPRQILGITPDEGTYIEVEPVEYEFTNSGLRTKAGWTPFAGMTAFGKVQNVVIGGRQVLAGGEIMSPPGSGQVLTK